jgi:hypothetical protein
MGRHDQNSDLGSTSSSIELKDDTVIVVLGASGDLAKKKTVGDAVPPQCNAAERWRLADIYIQFPALFGLVGGWRIVVRSAVRGVH